MAADGDTHKRVTKLIRWIARVWGGLVLLVALFILAGYAWNWVTTGQADPHAVDDYPRIENLPPLLMLLSALGSGIAWRWEGVGGAITVLSQLITLPLLLIHWPISEGLPRYLVAPYGVWIIVVIPGILFLACWARSRGRGPSATAR